MIKAPREVVSNRVAPVGALAAGPAPFAKWLGGKRSIAERILVHRPSTFARYVEPFVGGGAVFFALRRSGCEVPALLCDTNAELIETYRVVRDAPHALVKSLRRHVNDEEYYYSVRAQNPASLTSVERASRFIFLNKTCFNGLWRENKSGRMNSPFGRYVNPTICDEGRLLGASRALRCTAIERSSFQDLLDAVGQGDFVYCDPPYLAVGETASFTTYSAGGFSLDDHRYLAMAARKWASRGARVVLSNADVPLARDIYSFGFNRETVQVARAVNSRGDRRGKVGELLLRAGM